MQAASNSPLWQALDARTYVYTDRQIVHGKVWRLQAAALRERRGLITAGMRYKYSFFPSFLSRSIYLSIYLCTFVRQM